MKLTIFLTVMFVIFFGAKLTTGYFAPTLPLLQTYQTPLLWASVITGSLLGLCILIKILKELKELISNGKHSKEE